MSAVQGDPDIELGFALLVVFIAVMFAVTYL